MKHIGLFEGIGGFSLAARWMGWETVAWCEWDEFCQKVLKHHFPNAEAHGDITKTDFTRYAGKIDILTGGFPCQPYSSAGKRLGKEDDRHLWPQMLRAIREIQPRWVVGENVRGLTNWNGGLVFDEVQADLENEGYEVTPYLLPACAVNAPHRRDRVWFIAKNADQDGWRSEQRQSQSSEREQRNTCARDNERICANDAEIKVASNSRGSGRQKFDTPAKPGFAGYCSGRNHENVSNAKGKRFSQWNGESTWEQGENTAIKRYNSVPEWQNFPTQSPVCGRNDGVPGGLAGITVSRHRRESIKAYGNAIVPQVALQIFKAIQDYEQNLHNHPRSGHTIKAT